MSLSFNGRRCVTLALLMSAGIGLQGQQQVTFSANGFQRAEFNSGFGRLLGQDELPHAFIGQRLRLGAEYKDEHIRIVGTMQDIRIWGAVPTTKVSDGFLSFHEAYMEIMLSKHWKTSLGRQELNYDNARFLGNLDWAFQARAHDVAMIKYAGGSVVWDVGLAYNADHVGLLAQPFLVPGHYRASQFSRFEKTWDRFKFSALVWNNGVEQIVEDDQGNLVDLPIRYSPTIGLPTVEWKLGSFVLSGFYYHQLGRDGFNQRIDAFNASGQVHYRQKHALDKNGFGITLGAEYLSGTDPDANDDINRSYNPLYGTNHIHNGYMDYFFVGGRNNHGLGLMDVFLRFVYHRNTKWFISANIHEFNLPVQVTSSGRSMSSRLGTEVDLTYGIVFNKALSMQLGYSQIFASETLQFVQTMTNPRSIQQWGYAKLIYRPGMKKRFVGLLF